MPSPETVVAEPLADVTTLRTELDGALLDALRRASTRAEHVRLTRIAGLVRALGLAADGGSGG